MSSILFAVDTKSDSVSARQLFNQKNFSGTLYNRISSPTCEDDFYRLKYYYELKKYNGFLSEVSKLRSNEPLHPTLDDLTILSFDVDRWMGKKRAQQSIVDTFEQQYPDSPYRSRLPKLRSIMAQDPWFQAMTAYDNRDFTRAYKLFAKCHGEEAKQYRLRCLYEDQRFEELSSEAQVCLKERPTKS